ncbi:MAG: hypothetical protein JO323_20600 [Acidobacteriia bacterium]|nr:hypothetical protein [Terriglobia bacterium]
MLLAAERLEQDLGKTAQARAVRAIRTAGFRLMSDPVAYQIFELLLPNLYGFPLGRTGLERRGSPGC